MLCDLNKDKIYLSKTVSFLTIYTLKIGFLDDGGLLIKWLKTFFLRKNNKTRVYEKFAIHTLLFLKMCS